MGGWLSVNYIMQRLNSTKKTFAALDMGGASTQITFNSKLDLMANAYPLNYEETSFDNLFAQTHMRSGLHEAELRLLDALWRRKCSCTNDVCSCSENNVTSPCHRTGSNISVFNLESYGGPSELKVEGSGDFKTCESFLETNVLHLDWECTQKPCSILGTYMPLLQVAADKLQAFNGFYYAAKGLGVMNGSEVWNGALDQWAQQATNYCAEDGAQDSAQDFTLSNCFKGTYAYALLVGGYKLPTDQPGKLFVSKRLNGYSLSWTLGAVLHQKASYSLVLSRGQTLASQLERCKKMLDQDSKSTPGWVWPVTVCLVVLVVALFVAVGVLYRVWAKSQHEMSQPPELESNVSELSRTGYAPPELVNMRL